MAGTVQERNAISISHLFQYAFSTTYLFFFFQLFVCFFDNQFAHHRYLFGSRAKVRRFSAKYLQPIAKLTAYKSTLESIAAVNELEIVYI